MFLKDIGMTITRNASLAGLKLKEISPELCLGGGLIVGVATVVVACRATLKADEVLDKLNETKEKIKEADEGAKKAGIEYDADRDMAIAYRDAGIGFTKLYAPSVALGAVSVGLILCSYRTLKLRHLGAIAAYTALDEGFRRYRGRVVDELGSEADQRFATGAKRKTVVTKTVDEETGEVEEGKKDILTIEDEQCTDWSSYDRVFSKETSAACDTYDVLTNQATLRLALSYFNDLLDRRGYVYLSEVYERLGFTPTAYSRLVGWIVDPANPHQHGRIKFADTPDGLPEPSYHRGTEDTIFPTGRIVKGYRPTDFYLTFNVDGVIWNLTQFWIDRGCGA